MAPFTPILAARGIMRAAFRRTSLMRHAIIIITLALLVAMPVLSQEAGRPFTGRAQTQAKACAAAKSDAQEWVRQGKSEGRRRTLLQLGDCACTPSDGQVSCRIDAQVRDEVYEEEEEG